MFMINHAFEYLPSLVIMSDCYAYRIRRMHDMLKKVVWWWFDTKSFFSFFHEK